MLPTIEVMRPDAEPPSQLSDEVRMVFGDAEVVDRDEFLCTIDAINGQPLIGFTSD